MSFCCRSFRSFRVWNGSKGSSPQNNLWIYPPLIFPAGPNSRLEGEGSSFSLSRDCEHDRVECSGGSLPCSAPWRCCVASSRPRCGPLSEGDQGIFAARSLERRGKVLQELLWRAAEGAESGSEERQGG